MKDSIDVLAERVETKVPKGVDLYYKNHPGLPWGSNESPNYRLGLTELNEFTGQLGEPDMPCVFVADKLIISGRTYEDLVVVDAHGHIENGKWLALNGDSVIDVVDLVKEVYKNGHKVDILLVCAQYDFMGTENIDYPEPDYYAFLHEHGVVFAVEPENIVIPNFKMNEKGEVEGNLLRKTTFVNLERLGLGKR